MHPMVLLGDGAQFEARFDPFGDSASLEARLVHGLRRTYHRLRNHFRTHPMELLVVVGHVESRFSPFRDSVSVSARQVHGLHQTYHRLRNRFLNAPDGTPRRLASSGTSIWSVWR
jgi:hypothetical protein